MRKRCAAGLMALGALCFAPQAWASTTLTATLSNGAENPPTVPTLQNGTPRPASFGTASFSLNDAQTQMTMTVSVFNIDFTGNQTLDTNDNLTNAHIHAGPNVTPTTNGPVVWGFIGSPFNDNNPMDTIVTPFGSGVGGTVVSKWDAPEGQGTTLTAQLANILAGRSYINFHTVQFSGGEVRGNISVVPEPTTALAFAGVAALLRRRRA